MEFTRGAPQNAPATRETAPESAFKPPDPALEFGTAPHASPGACCTGTGPAHGRARPPLDIAHARGARRVPRASSPAVP